MKKVLASCFAIFAACGFVCAQDAGDLGKQVYSSVCIACHQPTGLGLPPVFPPIVKTEYVEGSPQRLISIVLKGIIGPIVVNGQTYANVMPPQELLLSDEQIAAVLTYVRSSFGNSYPPIGVELVRSTRAKVLERKTSWTEADLKNWVD